MSEEAEEVAIEGVPGHGRCSKGGKGESVEDRSAEGSPPGPGQWAAAMCRSVGVTGKAPPQPGRAPGRFGTRCNLQGNSAGKRVGGTVPQGAGEECPRAPHQSGGLARVCGV